MTQPLDLELDDTPTIASLTKLVGEENLELLSRLMGGKRAYIPHNPGPSSPIASCIGLDAAQKISQIYAGMMLDVPVTAGRRAKIRDLSRQGYSAPAIAHKLGLHRRTVQRTLDGVEDDRQQKLF